MKEKDYGTIRERERGIYKMESIVPDNLTLALIARRPKPVPRLTAHASRRLDSYSANSNNLCKGSVPLSPDDRKACDAQNLYREGCRLSGSLLINDVFMKTLTILRIMTVIKVSLARPPCVSRRNLKARHRFVGRRKDSYELVCARRRQMCSHEPNVVDAEPESLAETPKGLGRGPAARSIRQAV